MDQRIITAVNYHSVDLLLANLVGLTTALGDVIIMRRE